MKCKYAHCKHESKDIPKGEEVKNGSGYWHKDCLKESLEIREIVSVFQQEINPNVVVAQLRRTINDIVFSKGYGADFLLFGLKYFVSHKITLNYPAGLYYVLQNRDVQNEWNKKQENKIKAEIKNYDFTGQEETQPIIYKYKDTNKSKFSSVIGGA